MTRLRQILRAVALCALATPFVAAEVAAGPGAIRTIAETPECDRRGALGVSRVVEVDTARGAEFGQLQYGESASAFLREKEVVLTFDDGPLRQKTQQVLEALAAECTLATFFAVGRMAVVDPDMLRRVAAAGHTIAHHTWSHKNQKQRSFSRAVAEFELGLSAVAAAVGQPTAPFFRFPYLADPDKMRAYLKQRQFANFSIDIDSYDFRTRSPQTMLRNTMSQLRRRGKGIILFHDIQTSTANGMPAVLDQLKAGGYKIVHLVPKRPARTLPEYDQEAAVLHEKRMYSAAARPLKTAFQFNGEDVPVEAASVEDDDGPGRFPTPALRSSPQPAASDPTPTVPQWQRDVFGFSN